jgi:hypothetical protein
MFVLSVALGLALAVAYTATPLTVWVVALGALMAVIGRRGLPAGERRIIGVLLSLAIALRLLFVVLLFFKNIPYHHDQWLGELSGDGAYGLSRALRARDLLVGVPTNKFDSFVAGDMYGANSYVALLTVLQVLFGPVPYSIRLLNGLMFLSGAFVLFRFTRSAFGRLPAFAALTIVLFLPSFFVWSASLLKEPLYFLCTALFLMLASHSLRSSGPICSRLGAALLAAGALVVMEGVRHKTFGIGMLGWAIATALVIVFRRPRRYLPLAAAAGAVVLFLLTRPAVQAPLLAGLGESAKIHAGHVFTLGHGYKLLDDGFYYRVQDPNSSTLRLTPDEAARYVVRAIVSFVVTPLPWQAISMRELAYVPEQLVWYVIVAVLPIGIVSGWRRDAAATAVFLGYLIPTSLVLALTNGNVGTLVRLRGMVMVIAVWLSAVGACAALEWVVTRSARAGTNSRMPRSLGLGDPRIGPEIAS